MAFKDAKHVITCAGIVLWDGITKPETKDDGSVSHNLRIGIPNEAPELVEVQTLMQNALNESKWQGKMPPGGNDGMMEADVDKFGPRLADHTCFTAQTKRGVPYVCDVNGAELNSMQFSRAFYPGAIVKLLIHAYDYDNKQKGIAFGLDGIQVIDTKAPALAVGGGINPTEVAAAFASASGGGSAAPAPGGYTMTSKAEYTRAEYLEAGYTDQGLIDEGYMVVASKPKPPAPKPAAAPKPPPPKPKPPAPTKPHGTILSGGPVMTAKAEFSYQEYIDVGHTDESLVADGLMEPKKAAAPKPPAPKPKPPAPRPTDKQSRMTEHATNTYDEYVTEGWDDDALIAADFMTAE